MLVEVKPKRELLEFNESALSELMNQFSHQKEDFMAVQGKIA